MSLRWGWGQPLYGSATPEGCAVEIRDSVRTFGGSEFNYVLKTISWSVMVELDSRVELGNSFTYMVACNLFTLMWYVKQNIDASKIVLSVK